MIFDDACDVGAAAAAAAADDDDDDVGIEMTDDDSGEGVGTDNVLACVSEVIVL